MRVARHAQINQNNKVAISLQYLKKEVSDEVDFCMQISMKASYKLILWILMGMVKYSQSSQHSKFQCLYNISKKKLEMKLFFCPQKIVKVFYKLISTLDIKVSYKVMLSNNLKLLKVTSLQYLYNISKKKLVVKFFNKNMINEVFTRVIKYFCNAKHSAVSLGSSHVCCYLCTMFLQRVTNIRSFVFFVLSSIFERCRWNIKL